MRRVLAGAVERRRRMLSGLKVHAPQQVVEARVRAQEIENWNHNHNYGAVLKPPFPTTRMPCPWRVEAV